MACLVSACSSGAAGVVDPGDAASRTSSSSGSSGGASGGSQGDGATGATSSSGGASRDGGEGKPDAGGPDAEGGEGATGTPDAAGDNEGAAGTGGDGGSLAPSFTSMWSGTVVATPSQQLMSASGVKTYRTYVRPRTSGNFHWSFWISNGVDSTYGGGQANPNEMGGAWTIEAAYVADGGATHAGAVTAGTSVQVTFGGSPTRTVQPGERFWSDPIAIDLPAGHDLAFTWTLSGTGYPFVSASFITTYVASGKSIAGQETASGFSATTSALVAPQLLAYDRPVTERFCFLGDSITQGVGSGRDTYGYWVAKIGAALSPDIGIWNLGSGWARAADASSDGYWLYKAKQCTEVAVILGVNDFGSSGRTAAQVLGDLTTILTKLKQNDATTKTILFTVPTFDWSGGELTSWRQANTTIRTNPPVGADRVFDIAAVLSEPAPNDGLVQPQYHGSDAHPNDTGSTAIANAFLSGSDTNPPPLRHGGLAEPRRRHDRRPTTTFVRSDDRSSIE
jgi:lysophospholipase L1-like esterase